MLRAVVSPFLLITAPLHTRGSIPEPPKIATSYLAPTWDLRMEIQRWRRECGHAPRCQPGLTGRPPLTGYFATSGSLFPVFQVTSALEIGAATTKSLPEQVLKAVSPGGQVPDIGTMVDGTGCVLAQAPQNHTLNPSLRSPRENSEMHSSSISLSSIRAGRWAGPGCRRGTSERSGGFHRQIRKLLDSLISSLVRWFL